MVAGAYRQYYEVRFVAGGMSGTGGHYHVWYRVWYTSAAVMYPAYRDIL